MTLEHNSASTNKLNNQEVQIPHSGDAGLEYPLAESQRLDEANNPIVPSTVSEGFANLPPTPAERAEADQDKERMRQERREMLARLSSSDESDDNKDTRTPSLETEPGGIRNFLRTTKGKALAGSAAVLLAAGIGGGLAAANHETPKPDPKATALELGEQDPLLADIDKMPATDFVHLPLDQQRAYAYAKLKGEYKASYDQMYGLKMNADWKRTYTEASPDNTNQQILDDIAYAIQTAYLPEKHGTKPGDYATSYDSNAGVKMLSAAVLVNGPDASIENVSSTATSYWSKLISKGPGAGAEPTTFGSSLTANRPDDIMPIQKGSDPFNNTVEYKNIPVTMKGEAKTVPVYLVKFQGHDNLPHQMWVTR